MKQIDTEKAIKLLKKNKIKVSGKVVPIGEVLAEAKFPAAIKVADDFVVHKTDAGAVKININSKKELIESVKEIKNNVRSKFKKEPTKFLVQKMLKGTELIIGMKKDPQFGPVIMFGIGGIYVEIYKDISFRVAPLTKKDAREMVNEIQGTKILEGIRGEKATNKEELIELLLKVSKFAMNNNYIEELDFNPIIAHENKLSIIDVRLMQ